MSEQSVSIEIAGVTLTGDLAIPDDARGVVVFAHGSGSSRLSPRNQFVARQLQAGGIATLLVDLLSLEEEAEDRRDRHLRFDIHLLAARLLAATRWTSQHAATSTLPIGYFGASTGAAAALVAAAHAPDRIRAVVSRGGRPDLADNALSSVRAPTLLIVGGNDPEVLQLNKHALGQLSVPARLEVVPHAGHLFEEPGTLPIVANLARQWFQDHLGAHTLIESVRWL